MGRLIHKFDGKNEMICRHEDCDTVEEKCPLVNKDNCYCLLSVFNKLAEYEDADEQGLLLKLPCRIGDDVYFIPSRLNFKINILQGLHENNRVYHQKVKRITFTENGWYLECDKDLEYATDHILIDKSYKKTWFLSKEEAEQRLREMESD